MATGGKSWSESWRLATLVPVVLLLIVLLANLCGSCHGSVGSVRAVRNLSGIQRKRNNQIPSCNDLPSESQCSRNPKCRWCRSDDLNDMCFAKSEALRLPQEVFSCKINSARPNL